jgi:hypothetical protein
VANANAGVLLLPTTESTQSITHLTRWLTKYIAVQGYAQTTADFFLRQIRNGKITQQRIGVHSMKGVWAYIAERLMLRHASQYSGVSKHAVTVTDIQPMQPILMQSLTMTAGVATTSMTQTATATAASNETSPDTSRITAIGAEVNTQSPAKRAKTH